MLSDNPSDCNTCDGGWIALASALALATSSLRAKVVLTSVICKNTIALAELGASGERSATDTRKHQASDLGIGAR